MALTFVKFSVQSTKAKMAWIQERLGIPVTLIRDKTTVKAITNFQKENGIVSNGVVCEETFDLLNSKQ